MSMIYTYAIRHNTRDKWFAPTQAGDCAADGLHSPPLPSDYDHWSYWTEDFWEADCYDEGDKSSTMLPPDTHWEALTWAQYADLCGIERDDFTTLGDPAMHSNHPPSL